MTYEDLRLKLNDNHFYPALITRVKNKSKAIEGLQIDGPPILADDRGKRIKEIVGEGFSVDWISAHKHFIIKKK